MNTSELKYAHPIAVVIAAAVAAEMVPPMTDPAPGTSFNRLDTIFLPINVAPVTPAAEEMIVDKKPASMFNPKVTLMLAIIPI